MTYVVDTTDQFGRVQMQGANPEEKPRDLTDRNRAGRHAQIRSLYKKMAEAQLSERRHCDVVSLIQAIDVAKMRAADDHAKATAPIQKELRLIDEAQIALLLSAKPVDEAAEARRRELLGTIADANDTLQLAIETADKKLRLLHAERIQLAPKCEMASLKAERLNLGAPELLAERHKASINPHHWRTVAEIEREILAEEIK